MVEGLEVVNVSGRQAVCLLSKICKTSLLWFWVFFLYFSFLFFFLVMLGLKLRLSQVLEKC
jgi:hypothetical protein